MMRGTWPSAPRSRSTTKIPKGLGSGAAPVVANRTVGTSERTLGLVTESVTNAQLPSLPGDFLIYTQFLYLLEAHTVHVVIAHTSEVVEGKIIIAPKPL